MPNSFKYSTDAQTLALKKGNFYIGTDDVDKGPTSTTGYWNGITPPAGGYTIYLNKISNGPSIYTASNDSQLIDYTNTIAGTSYTTVNECLNYFMGQSDKLITNKDYPAIITNGLVLNLDASYTPSYPKNGTTWYDISSGGNNGTLVNGTTFSTDNGGSMVFDGTNDYVNIGVDKSCNRFTGDFAVSVWVNRTNAGVQWGNIIGDYYTNTTANPLEWQLMISNTAQLFVYNVTNGYVINAISSGFNAGTWINVVLSRIGSTISLYANSNFITSTTNTTTFGSATGNLNIGVDGDNSSEPLTGKIGNVMIYKNKGLTSSEVLQNYNATAFLGSQYNPANSAAAILSVNPSATDGYYWINTSLGPRQLYCIMSQGGWMGVTSEISPQINNLSTTTTWETNTNRRLQSGNSQILNVSLVEAACSTPTHYQLQSPNSVGISYTQTMLLIQRITTIGQCSSISGVVANGYYSGPEYSGTYTSNGMCLWGDGIFANDCCSAQNVSGLQPYWVMFGSGANQSLRYEVRCAGGSGQHYHMWFVK
jgi:hypothetical protein